MSTVLYMSMSLDGFIAGPNAGMGHGLGDGGDRLHDWSFDSEDGVNGIVVREFLATGATVAGRMTFEPAGGWNGDHHDGVPIWVYSRREPGIDISGWPLVTYTDDLATAFAEATAAAGDKNVLVHGATVAQLALAAGLLDELEIHVIPVLLGDGRRLFEGVANTELERVRVLEGDGVTHMRYRVKRPGRPTPRASGSSPAAGPAG
jgi:dihydrofolate reductase